MRDNERFLDETLPHVETVYRVARHCERDPWAAEDLVQETLLRAFASYEPDRIQDIRAWLVTICLNTSRSGARRRTRRVAEVLHADPGPLADPTPDHGVDDGTIDRLLIAAALDRLSPDQRTAIILMDVVGLTATETAAVLRCPRGTVLARVHRGRRQLARLLDPERVHGT